MRKVASDKENQDAINLPEAVETAENNGEQKDAGENLKGKEVAETVQSAENNGEQVKDGEKMLEGEEVAKTVEPVGSNREQEVGKKSLQGEETKSVETEDNHNVEQEDAKISPEGKQLAKSLNGESKMDVQTEIQYEKKKNGLHLFFMNISSVYKLDALGLELARIAVPAFLSLAADPLASLVDTTFIGHLGVVELGAVGISISVYNQIAKVAIYPLVSVTTSFVAEEAATCSEIMEENKDIEKSSGGRGSCSQKFLNYFTPNRNRRYISSVTSAIVVATMLGILMAVLIILAANPLLKLMGAESHSPTLASAHRYLTIRAVGSPAVLLQLAMQGVYRGFKDTTTPLYAVVIGDLCNIILDAILIVACHKGVAGAAIAHVVSQYLIIVILLFRLVMQVNLIPPSFKALNLTRFLNCGFLLMARVLAVTFCTTLASSLASHHGQASLAAFQVCIQIWLSSSLLADAVAVGAQAILATAFAKGDYHKIRITAARALQLGVILGFVLAAALGILLRFGAGMFTKESSVVKIVHIGLPFVALTQPLNSLAFVLDGVNFGASDYNFSAYSMVVVAAISIPSMIFLSKGLGFIGIWTGLTIYMTLRTMASLSRLSSARGPWSFIRK